MGLGLARLNYPSDDSHPAEDNYDQIFFFISTEMKPPKKIIIGQKPIQHKNYFATDSASILG